MLNNDSEIYESAMRSHNGVSIDESTEMITAMVFGRGLDILCAWLPRVWSRFPALVVRVVQVVHLIQVVYMVQVVQVDSLNGMNSENMWFTYFSRNRNGE